MSQHPNQPARKPLAARRAPAAGLDRLPSTRPRACRPVEWLATPSTVDIDLRKGRDSALADRLVARADWLPNPEAALVLAVFRDGVPLATLARAQGVCDRLLRRQLGRAVSRLMDNRALFVATHARHWTPVMATVARFIYLQGCSMRETARRSGFSLHTVRETRLGIDALFDTWSTTPSTPNRQWQ
jgi:hypothetical protein